MNISKLSSQAEVNAQLRGTALEQRILDVIRLLASKSIEEGKEYVYVASHVADAVPTTRKSLSKHDAVVTKALDEINARRRMVNGVATNELMRNQIENLKEELAVRERQLESLRSHHIEIYKRFRDHSLQSEMLLRKSFEAVSTELGFCIFCGTKSDDCVNLIHKSNVIDLASRVNK